jgi:hypothetical protein
MMTIVFNRSVEKFVEKGLSASGKSRMPNNFYLFAPMCSSSRPELTVGIPTELKIAEESDAIAEMTHETWKRSCLGKPGSVPEADAARPSEHPVGW